MEVPLALPDLVAPVFAKDVFAQQQLGAQRRFEERVERGRVVAAEIIKAP